MKYLNQSIYLSIIVIFLSLTAQAQNPSYTEVQIRIDSLIRQSMQDHTIPALSVGLIQEGNITLTKGYGSLNRNTQQQTSAQTHYQIASLSKTFTGIIANSLIAEGKLDPEASIAQYLPETIPVEIRKKFTQSTVKELFLHRAGIPRNSLSYQRIDGDPMLAEYSENHLLQDLEALTLDKSMGYEYSNLGYAILGYVLENASGLPYEELLQQYVVQAYQLERTSTEQPRQLTTPYRKDDRNTETSPWNTGKLTPASGIYSTVDDLSRLMQSQLAVYCRQDKQHPLYLTRIKAPRGDDSSYYGMGLWEFPFQRGLLYGHSGDMDGFASQYRFNSSQNCGVVLLTSSGGKWIGQLAAQISRFLEEHAMQQAS